MPNPVTVKLPKEADIIAVASAVKDALGTWKDGTPRFGFGVYESIPGMPKGTNFKTLLEADGVDWNLFTQEYSSRIPNVVNGKQVMRPSKVDASVMVKDMVVNPKAAGKKLHLGPSKIGPFLTVDGWSEPRTTTKAPKADAPKVGARAFMASRKAS